MRVFGSSDFLFLGFASSGIFTLGFDKSASFAIDRVFPTPTVGTTSSFTGGGFASSCWAIRSFLRATAAAEWLPGGSRGGDAEGTRDRGGDREGTAGLDLPCAPARVSRVYTCVVCCFLVIQGRALSQRKEIGYGTDTVHEIVSTDAGFHANIAQNVGEAAQEQAQAQTQEHTIALCQQAEAGRHSTVPTKYRTMLTSLDYYLLHSIKTRKRYTKVSAVPIFTVAE